MLEKLVGWAAGKRQPVPQVLPSPSETILAIVVPRSTLAAKDHKEVYAVREPYGSFFDTCALEIGEAIQAAYGEFFDFRRQEDNEGVSYIFQREGLIIKYRMTGADRLSSTSGRSWSNDVLAQLSMQALAIDLPQAATFLQYALKTNLLDYREEKTTKFGIFYKDREGTMTEGTTLLDRLGIRPTEAAEWRTVMYFAFYAHKIFGVDEPRYDDTDPLDFDLAPMVSMGQQDN